MAKKIFEITNSLYSSAENLSKDFVTLLDGVNLNGEFSMNSPFVISLGKGSANYFAINYNSGSRYEMYLKNPENGYYQKAKTVEIVRDILIQKKRDGNFDQPWQR